MRPEMSSTAVSSLVGIQKLKSEVCRYSGSQIDEDDDRPQLPNAYFT